ncbi:zinc-dependent metalloprotease [Pseudoduganella sp. LjRoot289]|uniref:zinc-dependent metalloprotease n=1 Tax=Pseudoduganella sp. LjRoot289 TaxID=3342314 RepID=UPI003ECEF2A6
MRQFVLKSISLSVLLALSAQALAQVPPTPTPPAPVPPTPDVPLVATTPAQPGAAATPPAAAKPDAAAPKPFAEVIKGANHLPGFLSLYQKDEKVWLELRPEQFDKPFFMSVNTPNGIGERGVYGGQMTRSEVVVFRKIGSLVQLIALNTDFRAKAGTPQALSVAQGFSDSLLSAAAVVSAPNPKGKGVLVEANALLFADIPGYATRLDYAFRMQYNLDPRNSSFSNVRSDEGMTGFHVNAHYFVPRVAAAPMVATPIPYMPPPLTLPDPRSMFLGFYYSFMPLPEQPMPARAADDRIGHFVTTSLDFTDDIKPTQANHAVNRWRLEKKDTELALSEPKQPIVYWLDKNIPEKYRESVKQGVLAWNAAFERIGFKDAIVVKQQEEKDKFDTMDARHASVRWYVGVDAGFAIGPSQVDPRSGEILDADIGMSDVFARGARRMASEDKRFDFSAPGMPAAPAAFGMHGHDETRCDYGMESAQEMGFAMELLEARGDFGMDSPQAEEVAQAYVRSVIMHEVGHTLGLRHNFRSSTIYNLKQLQDSAFTGKNGMTGSIMDYAPFNLAVKGEKQGEYVMSTLGPYDYWAIEYAYKPIAPEREKEELARIADRSNEPQLAFGTDQEAYGGVSDPDVNIFDLGDDPLAYFQKRLAISRELWDRVQTRRLKPGESYESLRRSFEYGFSQFARVMPVVVKYVGGVTHLRDHAGTGRATFTPVPVERQRAALKLLTNNLFKADSFKFTPDMVSRLGGDQLVSRYRPDISIGSYVLSLQAAALDQLMSDPVAGRLLDSQEKVDNPKKALALDELYTTVQSAVWSELKTGKDINSMRRNLQREHLKRVATSLLRASPGTRADSRSLQRQQALALQRDIRGAMSGSISNEARAHLAESYETLSQALKAPMLRTGA